MANPEVYVNTWSFCPACKGRAKGCTCDNGKVVERVLLSSLPRTVQYDYITSQKEDVAAQLAPKQ